MDRLTTSFDNRDALQDNLRKMFPASAALDDRLSPHVGGRREADKRLAAIGPNQYAKTRNMLDGAVTQLSPYLRHRVLTTTEVADAALAKVAEPWQAGKLIREIAWHDYFQRVYAEVGEWGVWNDLEPWKTGYGPDDYADDLPPEIEAGETGVDWVDHFAKQLSAEGYLHNHARMWLACYVVHARRIKWQAGAMWFLRHLVDGDPASNNLSWQWVASTFGSKPYFMNRDNVNKFSGGMFDKRNSNDPLDASYEQLEDTLFQHGPESTQDAGGSDIDLRKCHVDLPDDRGVPDDAVAWVHGDMLRPNHPALSPHAHDRPAIFVFDRDWTSRISLKPIGFVCECLAELPNVTVATADDLAAAVRDFAADRPIVTGDSPSPLVAKVAHELDATTIATKPLAELEGRVDLKRFSRYWRTAEKALKSAGRL